MKVGKKRHIKKGVNNGPFLEKDASSLLESLLEWCVSNGGAESTSQINPADPFFRMKNEWGDRLILWEIISPWVKDVVGIKNFYPDELDSRSAPRILVQHLVRRLALNDIDSHSHRNRHKTIDDWADRSFNNFPGLSDDFAEYSGTEQIEEPTVFLLGCPRSGTTLFRSMLAGHAQINAPPELHLLQFHSLKSRERTIVDKNRIWLLEGLPQAIEQHAEISPEQAFDIVSQMTRRDISIVNTYRFIHSLSSKDILLDKSPSMSRRASWLRRAEQMFSRPKYLFITRHPCAVMESLSRTRFFADEATNKKRRSWKKCEKVWASHNKNILQFLNEIPEERSLQLTYEDLVRNPEPVQRKVSAFLDIPFEEATLCPYSGARQIDGVGDPHFAKRSSIDPALADSWRSKPMPPSLSKETRAIASELGYELESSLGIS